MKRNLNALLNAKRGIVLDLGSAVTKKEPNSVRMGRRGERDVDVIQDIAKVPYGLKDESCLSILARHVVETIPRSDRQFLKIMDEWWRILKPSGRLMIVSMYGEHCWRDPLACSPVTQDIWPCFLPDHPSKLWERHRPKPWKMIACSFSTIGTIELVLEKITLRSLS